MNNRINYPTGGAGLLLLAIAVTPTLIKKCKPGIKRMGIALAKAADAMQKAGETRTG